MVLPYNLKKKDKVYFIPYTTDIPQIREGYVELDFYGKKFIVYDGKYCDDGQYFISKVENFDNKEAIIRLNSILRDIFI